MALKTLAELLKESTSAYLSSLTSKNVSPTDVQNGIYTKMVEKISIENEGMPKGSKYTIPKNLAPAQIAEVLMYFYHIVKIPFAGLNADPQSDVIAIYQDEGRDEGLYSTDEDVIYKTAVQYNYTLTNHELKEIMSYLRILTKRSVKTLNPDLIPVNNGIFDYKEKKLLPFSPQFIFIAKSRVDYNEAAENVVIEDHDEPWDLESWMESLSDDPEIVKVLWEIVGAVVRPHVTWNKTAWLYSDKGNNGKGTLCSFMRELCGPRTYASIPLDQFGEQFALEPLVNANVILVDENDVGAYIDKAAKLKALITGDVFQINRKNKPIIDYQFNGFMVQCLNGFPRVKDTSDSFYRRQLFIPMQKHFEGREKKYIKDDYLHRKEVLEYALKKVLNTNFYTLSEPEVSKNLLLEYKQYNDPIRDFFFDVIPYTRWDKLPYDFLYELFKAWFIEKTPNGKLVGQKDFTKRIGAIVDTRPDFEDCKQFRVADLENIPEPMISKYNIIAFSDKKYLGADENKRNRPKFPRDRYRGIKYLGNPSDKILIADGIIPPPITKTAKDDDNE